MRAAIDLSTPKLKRRFIKTLKKAWHFQKVADRYSYPPKRISSKVDFWRGLHVEARKECIRRLVYVARYVSSDKA